MHRHTYNSRKKKSKCAESLWYIYSGSVYLPILIESSKFARFEKDIHIVVYIYVIGVLMNSVNFAIKFNFNENIQTQTPLLSMFFTLLACSCPHGSNIH